VAHGSSHQRKIAIIVAPVARQATAVLADVNLVSIDLAERVEVIVEVEIGAALPTPL